MPHRRSLPRPNRQRHRQRQIVVLPRPIRAHPHPARLSPRRPHIQQLPHQPLRFAQPPRNPQLLPLKQRLQPRHQLQLRDMPDRSVLPLRMASRNQNRRQPTPGRDARSISITGIPTPVASTTNSHLPATGGLCATGQRAPRPSYTACPAGCARDGAPPIPRTPARGRPSSHSRTAPSRYVTRSTTATAE